MGLKINKAESKYMKMLPTQKRKYFQDLAIGCFKFKSADSLYLESFVKNENKMSTFTPKL